MQKSRILSMLSICLFTIFVSTSSHAIFIEEDLFSPNDAKLTKDTDTGLEWLDLTQTIGLSVNDIVNGVGNTWYQDFRYATRDEFDQLGANVFALPGVPYVETFEVMKMLGLTESFYNGFDGQWDSKGFIDPFAGDPLATDGGGFRRILHTPFTHQVYFSNSEDNFDLDYTNTGFGHFLVRTSAVPIPPTFLLLGTGLGLFGISKRMRA